MKFKEKPLKNGLASHADIHTRNAELCLNICSKFHSNICMFNANFYSPPQKKNVKRKYPIFKSNQRSHFTQLTSYFVLQSCKV